METQRDFFTAGKFLFHSGKLLLLESWKNFCVKNTDLLSCLFLL